MTSDERFVKEVIKRYGAVIDLKRKPYVLAEIFRNFRRAFDDIPDGGLPCGGTPPPPPPPPPESSIRNIDLVRQMNAAIGLLEKIDARLTKALGARSSPSSTKSKRARTAHR